jgi:hypothetical protein
VEAVAVELDREPVVGPAAVDPAAAGGLVGDRQGETVRAQMLKELGLEL